MPGFWSCTPYRGRGLMFEAVAKLVSWGFCKADLDRAESTAFMDNLGSRRIHAKLGLTEGGAAARYSPARGEAAPSITLTLARENWTPTS